MTDEHGALKANRDKSVIPGVAAVVIGLLALAIAAVEGYVFADIAIPEDSAGTVFGLSFGTTAYIMGYAAAGIILLTLGMWKIFRVLR